MKHKWAVIWGAAVAIVLSVLKILQYETFNDHSKDMGIFTSILWNTAHGLWFYDGVKGYSHFVDHCSLLLGVLSPLALWLPPAQLLVVLQSVALGSAVTLVWLLTRQAGGHEWLAAAMSGLVVCHIYLHSVSCFDFHPVALGIPILLAMLWCLEADRPGPVLPLALLALSLEEIMACGMAALGVYMYLRGGRWRQTGILLTLLCVAWFALVVLVVLPHFSGIAKSVYFDRYPLVGGRQESLWHTVLTQPWRYCLALVTPPEKLYHLCLFMATLFGLPLLARQRALLMVVPLVVLQTSSYETIYQLRGHYSAILLPFAYYCAIYGAVRLQPWLESLRGGRRYLAVGAYVLWLALNLWRVRSYLGPNHFDAAERAALASLMAAIPADASVATADFIGPHLAARHDCGLVWGMPKDMPQPPAEYILIEDRGIDDAALVQSGVYRIQARADGWCLLHRSLPSPK